MKDGQIVALFWEKDEAAVLLSKLSDCIPSGQTVEEEIEGKLFLPVACLRKPGSAFLKFR
ncbi:MAG: hypothetical protein HFI66_05350 [Lachnospiraceae bacterium]|jgi:hypothetical protein|nr:hypothetical protein [Lachnospiraceae bacterium]